MGEKKIEKIIGEMQCPKNFKCYLNEFKSLCKAEDIGKRNILVCLEDSLENCIFSIPIGSKNYCQCPLRVYIAKEFNK